MCKPKNSAKAQPSTLPAEEAEIPNQQDESASSDQESDADVSFHTIRQQAPTPFPPNMFMPYIEGPHMDWTVNDGLYHRFLKWRLKCKNILECEFAALPECQKCKKVVAWVWNLRWTSMCPGTCPRKTSAWTQFGNALKNFASPKQMK